MRRFSVTSPFSPKHSPFLIGSRATDSLSPNCLTSNCASAVRDPPPCSSPPTHPPVVGAGDKEVTAPPSTCRRRRVTLPGGTFPASRDVTTSDVIISGGITTRGNLVTISKSVDADNDVAMLNGNVQIRQNYDIQDTEVLSMTAATTTAASSAAAASYQLELNREGANSCGSASGLLFNKDENLLVDKRRRKSVGSLQRKIDRMYNRIHAEQMGLQENVDNYLRISSMDEYKDQAVTLRAAFERNNLKCSATVARLRSKVAVYETRLDELMLIGEGGGGGGVGRGGGVLRNMGQGIKRASLARIFVAKPMELAQHLRQKFITSPTINLNITQPLFDTGEMERINNEEVLTNPEFRHNGRNSSDILDSLSQSLEDDISSNSGPLDGGQGGLGGGGGFGGGGSGPYFKFLSSMDDTREEFKHLRKNINSTRTLMVDGFQDLRQSLELEQDLGEQIQRQVIDLSDLQQHELQNIRQEMISTEAKLSYVMDEKVGDLHEQIEKCITRVSKLEVQQLHAQQLLVAESLSTFDNTTTVYYLIRSVSLLLSLILFIITTTKNAISNITTFCLTRKRDTISFSVISLLWYKFGWPYYCYLFTSPVEERAGTTEQQPQ